MRAPTATYRLQFSAELGFEKARSLVPYLHRLGISDLYASPLFQARSGSTHGYDITDPLRLNPELGTEEEFEALTNELKRHDMGLLLDIVPNHMAASSENRLWADVLERGRASPHAPYFDIDWESDGEGKLVLPVLGKPNQDVLEDGEFSLALDAQGLRLRYYDASFPLDTTSYLAVLEPRLDNLKRTLGEHDPAFQALAGLVQEIEEARAPADQTKRLLFELYDGHAAIRAFIDENMRTLAGTPGDRRSFARLDSLLRAQPYRLAFWRTGTSEINYRRFFDVSGLVGIRVEDPQVLKSTHGLILQLAQEGNVTGLRIDHIDGLYDPAEYLRRLQNYLAPSPPDQDGAPGFYLLVEKILTGEETLPDEWPVSGTTGYDALNTISGVFVDGPGLAKLGSVYERFTGVEETRADVAYEQKKRMARELFEGELLRLAELLQLLAQEEVAAQRLTHEELAATLVEVSACLPVYRTYISDFSVTAQDRRHIDYAFTQARRRTSALPENAFDLLRRLLLLEAPPADNEQRDAWLNFVMGWQQFTGPLAAKGIEDTAYYVSNCLMSLNEVGGDPEALAAVDVVTFHRRNQARLGRWPHTLNATATHDTKRGEDARARMNVLSELSDEWSDCVSRWSELNRDDKQLVGDALVPDANEETLLYQTLVGVWPLSEGELPALKERLKAYVLKAAREAKTHTSWIDPDAEHEQALTHFVEAVMSPSKESSFLPELRRFLRKIAFYGATNSLAQLILKIASPGIPDFYQGSELWDLNLVDPDNRRAVDFAARIRRLDELARREAKGTVPLIQELLASWGDGDIKLYLTTKALEFRHAHRTLFSEGDYLPLAASGSRKTQVVAFARRSGPSWTLAAVPRLVAGLSTEGVFPVGHDVWGDTTLRLPQPSPKRWRNVLTGGTVGIDTGRGRNTLPAAAIFEHLPVALLSGSLEA